jgi:drug/metabolite transporter (DMT)-like permease
MEDSKDKIQPLPTPPRKATRGEKINRATGILLIVLSLTALLAVLSGYTRPPQPPPPDEETAAHIFQLSIVALLPALLLFLATADWKRPLRSARPVAFSGIFLVTAFGALYYLEHYR